MGKDALRGKRVEIRLEEACTAPAEVVYDVLADLPGHMDWAGERLTDNFRLLSIEPTEARARVGVEWTSTGADPGGRFTDRSVVTEAEPGRLLEFVTEARLEPKKGGDPIAMTVVHRYEIADGRVAYTWRLTNVSHLPGVMRAMVWPVLGPMLLKMSSSYSKKGLRSLVATAEERVPMSK